MKTATKQESALNWSKCLTRLNEAQTGQIHITYEDEQGVKRTGYCDLFDIKIVNAGNTLKFGQFVSDLQDSILTAIEHETLLGEQNKALNAEIVALNQKIDNLGSEVENIKVDLYPDYVKL